MQTLARLFAISISALVVAAVFALILWLEPQERLKKITHRPIASVQVDGEFLYLSQEQAQELISSYIGSGFLQLDLATLKSQLEKDPWVDYVSVARQWPDVLKVTIHEQQPIARWGSEGFLNMRGDIVRVENNRKLESLPHLDGDDRYAKEVMQQYLVIGKLLRPTNRVLTSLQLDETMAWTLELDNSITVKLGRDRVLEKLQHLTAASAGVLKGRLDQVQTVDMRYDKGFAVTWRDVGDQEVVVAEP